MLLRPVSGLMRGVTILVISSPLRRRRSSTGSPADWEMRETAPLSPFSSPLTFWPFTARIKSSGWMPARAAGQSFSTKRMT